MRTGAFSVVFAVVLMTIPQRPVTDDPSIYAVVNIPAARIDVWQEGALLRSYKVAVGAPAFPTPRGFFEISEIIWNPWWVPPASDWARKEKPTPPGRSNPMGRVKLKFAPLYFLHGTPDSSSVGYARSHGCIRMRNPDAEALARLLQTRDDPDAAHRIDRILTGGATRSIHLKRRIPLIIVYDRIEVTDTMVTLHPDPYRLGRPHLAEAIAEVEDERLEGVADTVRLRALLELPPTRRVVVPRSSMVRRADQLQPRREHENK